jgi:hypothetical protein
MLTLKEQIHKDYLEEQKLIDYKKPFYYNKFGTKYTIKDNHALSQEMASMEEKGLDCYSLQMQIRKYEIQTKELKATIRKQKRKLNK